MKILHFFVPLLLLASISGCSPPGDRIPVVGILEWERLELIAESNEPVARIEIQEGEQVNAGQVLLRQDATRAQSDLDAALAVQDQAQAKMDEFLAGPRPEELAEARAARESASVTLRLAKAEYTRVKKLHQKELASTEALDKAESGELSAQASLALNQARLDKLLHGTRAEQIAQARAAVAGAIARVRHAKINLQRLAITAPQDGRIDSLPFIVGEHPPQGSVVAVLLVGETPYARVYVPEQMRAGIRPGSLVEVRIDGIESVYAGRVRTISRDPSFTPYYSLTANDRSRLVYLAKVDLLDADAETLSAGAPLELSFVPETGNGQDQ
ncbi:MAG: hypothetical protein OI74_15105 [Gammaproteobacteria bacterium (ex Lamellibrachia satsuma)]|nr:MAG: HlyD family efflux transporter periplasmic adaptor subunit [Gammaproteobacteria bacterium (ex Lamellibrachia satsuma)]RRS31217.1 MAG: hypothetical protein OI74_15105 [Gammaproteobacteria bacterium (ex Lamellibrachia satsuma)]RRS33330.1 MAG: hypothetical protein NV67_16515 [Gammaproteobacteria bacterium (ex Lamellibrachia satsuma)]